MIDRRDFLKTGLGGLILLGAGLPACSHSAGWPEGMAQIHWDRDTCTRCRMVISDRRFAVQMRGGPKDEALKFDDIGCAVIWAKSLPWAEDPSTRLWVASIAEQPAAEGPLWLDGRSAFYLPDRSSPMGYNFGAIAQAAPGALDFATMRERVFAEGR